MTNRSTVCAAWCAGLLLLGAAMPRQASAQDEALGIAVGATPAAVVIQDLDGKPADLGRLTAGRPALVEFYAVWCTRCEALRPKLAELHGRYASRMTFVAVAVAVGQNPAAIARHLERHPQPFPVLWDANGAAVRAYRAPTTSYIVTLDAKGTVAYTGVGEDQDLEAAVRRALR